MNYFEGIDMFSQISPEDQKNLSDFCQLQELVTGEQLFKQWDEAQALYVVLEGELAVDRYQDGESKYVATLKKGDIVWEMAFLWHEEKRNATLTALKDTKLIVLIHFGLSQVLEKYPELYKALHSIIEERSEENKNI